MRPPTINTRIINRWTADTILRAVLKSDAVKKVRFYILSHVPVFALELEEVGRGDGHHVRRRVPMRAVLVSRYRTIPT